MLNQSSVFYLTVFYTQSRSVMLPRVCLTATAGTYLVRGSYRVFINISTYV